MHTFDESCVDMCPLYVLVLCWLFSGGVYGATSLNGNGSKAKEQQPPPQSSIAPPIGDCPNCVDEPAHSINRWTMPLLKLGEKRYYLGIFFKVRPNF
ncbi:putative C-type lectin [Trypoxylus dichotomus]